MRTVADMVKALEGLPPMTPVQVGLVRPDGGRVVREIDAIEAQEGGIVLLIEGRTPGAASEAPVAHMIEANQTGEAVAARARTSRWRAMTYAIGVATATATRAAADAVSRELRAARRSGCSSKA